MLSNIKLIETILYVNDQEESRIFYEKLFRTKADLHVPGMTEFIISETSKIGLMPNKGIAKILSNHSPDPDLGIGIPRCELYLYVEEIEMEYQHALSIGAKLINPLADRDWGDKVCYFADPDAHIIAFAKKL